MCKAPVWLGSIVVRESHLQSAGREFRLPATTLPGSDPGPVVHSDQCLSSCDCMQGSYRTSPVVFHDFPVDLSWCVFHHTPEPCRACKSTSFFNTVNTTFAAHCYGMLYKLLSHFAFFSLSISSRQRFTS